MFPMQSLIGSDGTLFFQSGAAGSGMIGRNDDESGFDNPHEQTPRKNRHPCRLGLR